MRCSCIISQSAATLAHDDTAVQLRLNAIIAAGSNQPNLELA